MAQRACGLRVAASAVRSLKTRDDVGMDAALRFAHAGVTGLCNGPVRAIATPRARLA